jgi:hypothetical protein
MRYRFHSDTNQSEFIHTLDYAGVDYGVTGYVVSVPTPAQWVAQHARDLGAAPIVEKAEVSGGTTGVDPFLDTSATSYRAVASTLYPDASTQIASEQAKLKTPKTKRRTTRSQP